MLQTSGDELVKINDAKSIPQYMEDLKKEFKNKSLLREYTKNPIPVAKKKFSANKVDADNKDKKTNPEWAKIRKPIPVDNEIKAELNKNSICS
mgnify:CR=1 FL=1